MVDLSTIPLIPLVPTSQPVTFPKDNRGIGAVLNTPLNTETSENTANVHSMRGRRSVRGHPPGRKRCGGRGAVSGRGERALRDSVARTAGWRVQPVIEQPVQLEHEFTSSLLSEGARLFSHAALERMKIQFQVRQLHLPRLSSFFFSMSWFACAACGRSKDLS